MHFTDPQIGGMLVHIITTTNDMHFTDPEIGDVPVHIVLPDTGLHHSLHCRICVTRSNVMPGRKVSKSATVEDVALVEFMYLVFTCMPGESYHRQLRSLLLCLCDVFQVLINSLVC